MPLEALAHRVTASIVNTVREPLLLLDAGFRVRLTNRSFYRTFDVTAEETVGREIFSLGNGQWDIPALRHLLADVLPEHRAFDDFEVVHDFPGLGRRIMWLNARELEDTLFGERFILVAIDDVTERCRADASAARHAEDLARANLELRRSNEALAQFAHVASHDLQEPLRKVRSYIALLEETTAAKLDRQEAHYLTRIAAAAERAQTLIADVLTLARITSKARSTAPVSLATIVGDVVGDLELQLRETGGSVEVDPLPTIEADAAQMRQLFQNLIANAVKFARADVSPRVHVRARSVGDASGRRFEITVEDNGIGLDEEYCEVIFEPFHRLHRREAYGGTGMGLAICRRVVERHHGTIIARSRPAVGTTFVLTLPERQPHPDPAT